MRINNTQFRNFDAGRPKNTVVKTNRKRFSSNLSSDYTILLQLYCINKDQANAKKELKYEKSSFITSRKVTSKSSYSILSSIVFFLTVTLSFNKKARQEMTLIAE